LFAGSETTLQSLEIGSIKLMGPGIKSLWIVFFVSICFCFVPLCISGTITYEYDKLNRIMKMEKAGEYAIEYSYDAAGNRSQVITQLQTPAFDSDGDGDIDGEDLHDFLLSGPSGGLLQSFALQFGLKN
jgi:YD repeat-containing protein